MVGEDGRTSRHWSEGIGKLTPFLALDYSSFDMRRSHIAKTIQPSSLNYLDPYITVLIATEGPQPINEYPCGRGSHIAPETGRLRKVLKGIDVDLESFITKPRSPHSNKILKNPSRYGNRPFPTVLNNTPDVLDVPLVQYIAPRLPNEYSAEYREYVRSFLYRIDFRKLRALYSGWIHESRSV
jgi:hypothetical protein